MSIHFVADGGGTKTEYLLFDTTGQSLAYWRTPGTNSTFLGDETAAQRVKEGLKACLEQAEKTLPEVESISLFIPGFESSLEAFKSEIGRPDIRQTEDFWNAFYGALAMPVGIVALAGTGSFAAGVNRNGEKISVGGWGPLFGDEGSGYHIGVLCLRAVTGAFDRGEARTILTEMLFDAMDVKEAISLRKAAYAPNFTRDKVAALSWLVAKAASQGDLLAQEVLADAATALAHLVALCAERLQENGLHVSITGGISQIGEMYTAPFASALRKLRADLRFVPARYDPLVGAMLWHFVVQQGKDITAPGMADKVAAGVAQMRRTFLE